MKDKKRNRTSIGGQAVIEGVMMRGERSMVTAVRDADGEIRTEAKRVKPVKERNLFLRFPIIRGVYSFVQSLFGGTKILMRSASVFGEGEPTKFEKWLSEKFKIDVMNVVGFISVVLGLALAIALFIIAPTYLRKWILGDNCSPWAKNFLEGGFKLVIFIGYILLCSLIKDVRRTFMYHGAEHKTISCFEKGLPLTVENAKKCTRVHDRCGTTFIVFVMVISIIVFACFESLLAVYGVKLHNILRILCKIALLPLVAGLSYELLKGLSKTTCWVFYPIKIPGLLLQRVTTREPDDDMLEVAITAFNGAREMDADLTIPEREFETPLKRKDLLQNVKVELKNAGIDEEAEAEWIVSIKLGIKRDEVNGEELVSVKDIREIEKTVKERVEGRPLWYIIGDTDFMGYIIKVDERVLIPRPETELLAEKAMLYLNKDSEVLDLCTGSGAIAVAIAKKTGAKVTAIDISKDALTVAKENANINDVDIEFIESDLFSNISEESGRKFDVIVTNPPYIKTEDIDSLQKEIKDYEPKIALDGGKDGLDFYRTICKTAKNYLKDNGVLLMECGDNQADTISKMLFAKSVEIIKDYEGKDRIIKAVF